MSITAEEKKKYFAETALVLSRAGFHVEEIPDNNLDEFYDYEKYALQRMEQQSGMFTDRGYISCHGAMSLEELMMEDPCSKGPLLGGMSL